MNKCRNKGKGRSVLLSFVLVVLDYILRTLESGKNSSLCESSKEEEEDAGQRHP